MCRRDHTAQTSSEVFYLPSSLLVFHESVLSQHCNLIATGLTVTCCDQWRQKKVLKGQSLAKEGAVLLEVPPLRTS
jgi:hypothetical protein